MKILFIASAGSIHSIRWINYFVNKKIQRLLGLHSLIQIIQQLTNLKRLIKKSRFINVKIL